MLNRPIPVALQIAIPFAVVALAVLTKLALEPAADSSTDSPYLLLALPVLIAVLLGGFWSGVLATALSAVAVATFFTDANSEGEYVQVGVFVVEGLVLSLVGGVLRKMNSERAQLLERERTARAVAEEGRRRYAELISAMGVAIYTTDGEGRISSYNEAAAEMWGRHPALGEERWCGSLRLYHPDGTPMAHDKCPMARAIKEGVPIRGEEAILERPDGTLINFVPFPTPLHSSDGRVTGAVNVLADITERLRAESALRATEEKYRSIFENASFGVFQTTAQGAFLSANGAMARMLGYDSPEQLIEEVTDIGSQVHVDPRRREEFVRALERDGVVGGFKAQLRRRDGELFWISLSGRALRDNGQLVGFEGVAEDITPRVMAEAVIANSLKTESAARVEAETAERRFRFLSEASGALAASLEYGLNLERIPEMAVPEMADICEVYLFDEEGKLEENVIAASDEYLAELVKALHASHKPIQGPHMLARVLSGKQPILFSDVATPALLKLAQDKVQRDILEQLNLVSYMAVPLVARGELIGAMTFGATRSEKKFGRQELTMAEILSRRVSMTIQNARLFRESQQAQEELRAAAEAKDEFLGVMSHELRTPITSIMGGARLLRSRNGTLDDMTRGEILADIEGESDRMYRMVENLLTLGRLELGQEVDREPVLTQRILQKMATSFMNRKPGRRVEVDAEEGLAPAAAAPAYLELAIRNLLSNADKYSPAGEAIEIKAVRRGDELDIAVLDRGPGIDPEEAETIFDRFYRSAKTSGQTAGVGLGLTVCKRMIEAQSGRVWARRREGGGAEIGLTIPVYKNGASN